LAFPALVVVNPVAAGGRAGRVWNRLEPGLRAAIPDLSVRRTAAPGDAEQFALQWGRQCPGGTLLAAGGDGTVHEAVNGWWQSGATGSFGVIPAGSGNDFARNAGLPLDPEAAARRLPSATLRPSDLGRLTYQDRSGSPRRRVFLNSVSLGVSVRANRLARHFPAIGPGRLRYALGALGALLSAERTRYLLRDETGVLFEGAALNLTVANGASFGGGMPISPGSSPRDGILDLVVLRPMRGLRALLALSRLQRGTHVTLPEARVTPLRGPLRIQVDRASWRAESDGQELEGSGDLTLEVLPGGLALLG